MDQADDRVKDGLEYKQPCSHLQESYFDFCLHSYSFNQILNTIMIWLYTAFYSGTPGHIPAPPWAWEDMWLSNDIDIEYEYYMKIELYYKFLDIC